MEVQPFQRFKLPIFTDGLRDTLNQLLSVGLRTLGLVGDLLETERFHMPSSLAAPVSIDILQNYTMILHDHPITYAPACL